VSPPLVSARAVRGELRLRAERDATGKTVLADRHAAGAFHVSKPYWDGHALMVQWINPTAGIFAGDVLESDVSVGQGASLLLTTPSATRIHTRIHRDTPAGEQCLRFHVATGGFLEVQSEWLIPQKQSAFQQFTKIELDAGAGLLFAELVAPGRVAHGEALAFDQLVMRLQLRRDGELLLQERIAVSALKAWPLCDAQGQAQFAATVLVCLHGLGQQALQCMRGVDLPCLSGMTLLQHDLIAVRLMSPQGMNVKHAMQQLRSSISHLSPSLRSSSRKL
jgi:urease accessory protein